MKAYVKSDKADVASLKIIPLVFAGWLRYLMAVGDDGENFELSPDPLLDEVCPYVKNLKIGTNVNIEETIRPLLKNDKIWGVNLYDVNMVALIVQYLDEMLQGQGAVRNTLKKYL